MNNMDFFKKATFAEQLEKQKKIRLLFDNGLHILWPSFKTKSLKIDIVFPAMHGTYGEDGSLMGLLRMANVPFVGCDIFASSVAMDKVLTKQVVSSEEVPVVPYIWFSKNDWNKHANEIKGKISKLNWPVFVKPVHLGSSIAISKIKEASALENALEVAFHYDDKVLVEESVENLIEVTLPIMGNNTLQLGLIEKPLNKGDFFDFNDKYLSENGKNAGVQNQYSELPANIDADLQEQVRTLGVKTYRTLGCSGIARVDFLINSNTRKVFMNEVNTLPGSLYAHNWKKSGVSNIELISTLIALGEERFAEKKTLVYAFQSDILQKVNGSKISQQ